MPTPRSFSFLIPFWALSIGFLRVARHPDRADLGNFPEPVLQLRLLAEVRTFWRIRRLRPSELFPSRLYIVHVTGLSCCPTAFSLTVRTNPLNSVRTNWRRAFVSS